MSEPITSPSLLAVTAPAPRRRPESADGFDETLSAASESGAPATPADAPSAEAEGAETPEAEAAADTPEQTADDINSPDSRPDDAAPEEEQPVGDSPAAVAAGLPTVPLEDEPEPTAEPRFTLASAAETATEPAPAALPGEADGDQATSAAATRDTPGSGSPSETPDSRLEPALTIGESTPSDTADEASPDGLAGAEETRSVPGASAEAVPASGGIKQPAATPVATTAPAVQAGRDRSAGPRPQNDAAAEADASESNRPATSPAVASGATDPSSSVTPDGARGAEDARGDGASPGPIEPTQRGVSAAERAERSTPAPERSQPVDAARFVARVGRAFEAAQERGGGPIQIRLSPPELGSLSVRLEVQEGVLTASLETETQAARNVLLDNLPALRERLAEQQIRVEQFDVDVRDEGRPSGEGRDAQSQADRQADGDKPREESATPARSETPQIVEPPLRPSTISFEGDRVDLVA